MENGCLTLAIAIDFSKAFDLVWRDGLIIKMLSLGIKGNILKWIENFLTKRENIIKIHNNNSCPYSLDNGIPQGSSLSPTLFLIMINDFPSLSTHTSQAIFADDVNIWRSGTNLQQITYHLQDDLQKIETWCSSWGFVLNPDKITGTLFTNKNSTDPITLKIKDKTINIKNKFKFLGLTFDNKLTWKHHIDELETKSKQTLNIMKSLHGQTWGMSNKTLLTVYKALIRSKLDYASFVYMEASCSNLKRLDSIQYKALSIVLGAAKGTSLASLLAETKETSLNLRRQSILLKYLLNLKSKPMNMTNETLQDKPYPNLNLKYKSSHKLLIEDFLKEINIAVKLTDKVTDIYYSPWNKQLVNIFTDLQYPDGSVITDIPNDNFIEILTNKFYPGHTQIFVDASKSHKATAAIHIPHLAINMIFQLPTLFSIFATEAVALLKALELTEELKLNKTIIFSDNKSLLSHIKNPNNPFYKKNPRPLLIKQLREKIKPGCIIYWIPGHSHITNHIITDNLTKLDSKNLIYNDPYIELEEILPLVDKKYKKIWQNEWIHMRGATEYSNIHHTNTLNQTENNFLLNRKYEIITNRLRLGNNNCLNYYLHKIGKSDTPLCDLCKVDENTKHFLTECTKHKSLHDEIKQLSKYKDLSTNLFKILSNSELLIAISKYIIKNNINI